MVEQLDGLDLSVLARISDMSDEEIGREAFAAVLSFFPAIFCLNDQERAALEQSDAFSMGGGITLDQLECFFDALGPAGLGQLMDLTEGKATELPAGILPAVMACGIDIMQGFMPPAEPVERPTPAEGGGGPSGLPGDVSDLPVSDEQLQCLMEELGTDPTETSPVEMMEAIQSGEMSLLQMMGALSKCGIDMGALVP